MFILVDCLVVYTTGCNKPHLYRESHADLMLSLASMAKSGMTQAMQAAQYGTGYDGAPGVSTSLVSMLQQTYAILAPTNAWDAFYTDSKRHTPLMTYRFFHNTMAKQMSKEMLGNFIKEVILLIHVDTRAHGNTTTVLCR